MHAAGAKQCVVHLMTCMMNIYNRSCMNKCNGRASERASWQQKPSARAGAQRAMAFDTQAGMLEDALTASRQSAMTLRTARNLMASGMRWGFGLILSRSFGDAKLQTGCRRVPGTIPDKKYNHSTVIAHFDANSEAIILSLRPYSSESVRSVDNS